MSKKKTFWENGGRVWIWILIISFILGAVSQASVALFKSNQAYECSQKNETSVINNDKRIEVLNVKLENIEKTTDEINKKIDRALRR